VRLACVPTSSKSHPPVWNPRHMINSVRAGHHRRMNELHVEITETFLAFPHSRRGISSISGGRAGGRLPPTPLRHPEHESEVVSDPTAVSPVTASKLCRESQRARRVQESPSACRVDSSVAAVRTRAGGRMGRESRLHPRQTRRIVLPARNKAPGGARDRSQRSRPSADGAFLKGGSETSPPPLRTHWADRNQPSGPTRGSPASGIWVQVSVRGAR